MAAAGDGHDRELVRQVREGGRVGEDGGLELLLRRRPQCWEDAVALMEPVGSGSSRALEALADAWRAYRRMQRAGGGSGA